MTTSNLEQQFLAAATELARRQRELTPLVAQAIGTDPFEYWILRRSQGGRCPEQKGQTADGEWSFFFHGREFDLRHRHDGRNVRVDFGPGGRLAFNPGGVGQFVCHTKAPWRVFPELKRHLCGPNDYADYWRCCALADTLIEQGHFGLADARLVALRAKYTRVVSETETVIEIPEDELPEERADLVFCDNLVLTAAGGGLSSALSRVLGRAR
jgi:hypothetical protein